jgi:signal transduction histidine kinase
VSTRPDASSASADDGDERMSRRAIAVGLLLCVAYVLVGSRHDALRNLIIYAGVELAAILAIVAGVRRYRPTAPQAWLLIALGLTCWWIGDVTWAVYQLADRDPFPSPGDVFYLAGYPLLAAGLFVAVRHHRQARLDRAALIDAAIVTVVSTLLAWVYLGKPVVDDPELTGFEKFVTILYPFGDVVLFGVAIRFAMSSTWSARAMRLLVAGLGLTLVGDVIFNLGTFDVDGIDTVSSTILLAGVVLIGGAALDPTMRALTEEHGYRSAATDRVRIGFICIMCLVPPFVLAIQAIQDEELHLWANIGAMVLLGGLAVARLNLVATRARRSASREATLRRFATDILGVAGDHELYAAAGQTAGELIGDGATAAVHDGAEIEAHDLAIPVDVQGETVATLVIDDTDPMRLRRARDSLATVAVELSLALERQRLLATEREAADKLTEQNAKLRELDKMKDQFISSTTHELRTPLTSMVGYLEILRDGEAGALNDDQAHFLAIVDRNCRRLNDLIDDILLTARMDSGRFSLERQPVDLAALVSTQVESMRATAQQAGVDLRLVVDEAPRTIDADPMRLGQMLDNLLSNAVKFTPAGGRVTVSVTALGDIAHLEVSDTGVGIPEDELGKLFERFYRASTATAIKGTGLGLSITKGIVEAHGGTIAVRSEPGVGTTFSVDLPLPAANQECRSAEPSSSEVHQ